MTFSVDGETICTIERTPFECRWDAGPEIRDHLVRVVALLADGRRLVRSVSTRGRDGSDVNTVFRVGVEAVELTAVVTDWRGRFVRDLKRDEFIVKENGVVQEVTYFGSQEAPLEVVVAIDVSGSMSAVMERVKEAVKRFLAALRPVDAVTIVGCNDNVFTVTRRETDAALRAKAVDRLGSWGSTAIYDATIKAVELVGRRPGRKAIVLFTDGADRSSRVTEATARRHVEAGNAVVCAVALGDALNNPDLRKNLERFAEATGGQASFEKKVQDLDEAFGRVFRELSSHYLIAYMPSQAQQDGSWREIEVEVTNKKAYHVRSREGYLAARNSEGR